MQHTQSTAPRTVTIGGVTKVELLKRLTEAHVEINAAGHLLLADERFCPAVHPQRLRVTQVSVASLGLQHGGLMAQIMSAAEQQGLYPCPLELAPHLRLQFLEQEEGMAGLPRTQSTAPPGSLTVVSLPLSSDDEVPKGFYLRRMEGKLWLRGYTSWQGHVWQPEDQLLFQRPESAA
jgi:hypothetical protein